MSSKRDTSNTPMYLCSPVNALVEGLYEENIPLSAVKKHGDFGLGTFDDLDGEMVMTQGRIYQITADGTVHEVPDDTHTPFAAVTVFQPTFAEGLENTVTYEEFEQWLLGLLPSPNLFYAIRVTGEFEHIRARSVPKQHNYRPLSEAAHDQKIFTFEAQRGELVGFYTPAFMASLNVPGLHLHFLSDDRQRGGHLLECKPSGITAEIQLIHELKLSLPMTHNYLTQDFVHDATADLEKVEK